VGEEYGTQRTQGGQVAKLSRDIFFKNRSLEHKNIVFGIIKVSRHTGGDAKQYSKYILGRERVPNIRQKSVIYLNGISTMCQRPANRVLLMNPTDIIFI
jgi:hypothetical protein